MRSIVPTALEELEQGWRLGLKMQGSYGSASTTMESQICQMESWEVIRDAVTHKHIPPPRSPPLQRSPSNESTSSFLKAKVHECCDPWREKLVLRQVLCRYSVGRGLRCGKVYHEHFIRRKNVVVVLLISALFSAAIHGVTSELLKIILGTEYVLSRLLILHGVTEILFPISGHIADAYIGRHNVIRFSLWMAWLGFAILGVTFSLDDYNNHISVVNRYITLPLMFLLLSISHVCFMPNIIPFGLDQLQGASHVHFSSFFNWWYWTLNIGVAFVHIPSFCKDRIELSILVQAEIGLVCVSLAVILDALLKEWFTIEPACRKGNPLKQIVSVLKRAAKSKRSTLLVPSTVRHEVDLCNFSRMDSIKKRYGGEFDTEQVEDVRTFFRMLLVLFSIGFPIFSYYTVFGAIGVMSNHMSGSLAQLKTGAEMCHIDVTLSDSVSAVLLLMLIPLLDLVLVPFLRYTTVNPSILKRLSIGATLAVLSVFVMFLTEALGSYEGVTGDAACMFNTNEQPSARLAVGVYWLLLPLIIVTVAEIFIFIPSYEFICAQSPYNMRGLLVGIFFSCQSLFSLASLLLQLVFSSEKVYSYPFLGRTGRTCAFWYFLIAIGLSVLGLAFYAVVACKYKRRKRDDVFNEVTLIEEYFTSCVVNNVQS